jgi:hypothetical protein
LHIIKKMCRTDIVRYSLACGHYRLPRENEGCDQATIHGYDHVPCDALIYELEIQRTGTWGWKCTVEGRVIQVMVDSSGHCGAWQEPGYKKPDYMKLAKSTEPTTAKDSEIGHSSSSTTTNASKDMKLSPIKSTGEAFWVRVKAKFNSLVGLLSQILKQQITKHTNIMQIHM